jgi:hypothetical protein
MHHMSVFLRVLFHTLSFYGGYFEIGNGAVSGVMSALAFLLSVGGIGGSCFTLGWIGALLLWMVMAPVVVYTPVCMDLALTPFSWI